MNYQMARLLELFNSVQRDELSGGPYDAARRERLFWDFLAVTLGYPEAIRVSYHARHGPNSAEFLAMIVRELRDDFGPERLAAAIESAGLPAVHTLRRPATRPLPEEA